MEINTLLAQNLINSQFPNWKHLPIKPVEQSGWDNCTFHLGDEMTIRLPSKEEYAPQILKEYNLLSFLSKYLSLKITTPLALGKPNKDYPWHWSINNWIDGETVSTEKVINLNKFAKDLGQFLVEFQNIPAEKGPIAGPHNFHRGGDLSVYNDEMCLALPKIKNLTEQETATSLWKEALSSHWKSKPVWVHGDFATGNILLKDGELNAVIDFGCMCVGDPACDLAIAWNFFTGDAREVFKQIMKLDESTWVRALGWTLWKTLCWPIQGTDARRILVDVYNDYQAIKLKKGLE